MATTRYEGNVPSGANELLPLAVRENGRYSTRNVTNPTGLPAGAYIVAEYVTNPQAADGAVMVATDVSGNQWSRRSVAFPSTWSAWQPLGGGALGVTSFNGRVGAVVSVAGDYNTTLVTNVSTVPGATTTNALDNLQTNKVTLGNAIAAQDILVATAAGDNYAPSQTILPGRIGAIQVGQLAGVTQTSNGSALEATGDGAIPLGSLIRGTKGATASVQANYSIILADANSDLAFGQAGNAQNCIRALLPAGLPAATGGNGAYAFSLDIGATKPFFVNSDGNVCVAPLATAIVSAVGVDINNMLTIGPSNRAMKKDITAIADSSFIQRLIPRRFGFVKDAPSDFHRFGLVIDEMQSAGVPDECFNYMPCNGCIDRSRPVNVDWTSITAALIAEVQKLRSDIDSMTLSKGSKPLTLISPTETVSVRSALKKGSPP